MHSNQSWGGGHRAWVRAAVIAAVGIQSACTGALNSRDGLGDQSRASSEIPLRILTASEIRYTLVDLFPGKEFNDINLGAARPEGRYTTFAEGQAVNSVFHQSMESAFAQVAERVSSDLPGLMGCDVQQGDTACVRTFLQSFGPKVHRLAWNDEDLTTYVNLYSALKTQSNAQSAVKGVLQAMFLSPYFLYLAHDAHPDASAAERARLSGNEIAARLSFLLWSSSPDAALIAAAKDGSLDSDEGIRTQATRMMADPRFSRFLETFVMQWLEVDHTADISKDSSQIPEWNSQLAADLQEEARRFVVDWGMNGGDFGQLLTSNRRFLNARTSSFLGIGNATGDALQPVEIADRTQASGVFTLGAFLSSHASITGKFGPTYRGKWLRKRLLCGVIGSPPPDALTKAPREESVTTTRAYHEILVNMPVCGSCHSNMDSMAFSLESFDGAGRFRTMENENAVNTSARINMSGDAKLDGEYANIAELAAGMAESDVPSTCFAQNLVEYTFGRMVTNASDSVQFPVGSALSEGGIRNALLTLVTATPFVSTSGE